MSRTLWGPRQFSSSAPTRRSLRRARTTAFGGIGLVITGLACLFVAQESVEAATITWSAAQNVSGDSDVATIGTLEYAFNFGTTSVQATTVNGVAFSAFGIATPNSTTVTVGNVTVAESPGFLTSYSNLGTGAPAFTNLSSGYQTLLGSGGSAGIPNTITVTLAGLTIGDQYSLQWWSSNNAMVSGLTTTTATSGSNSVTLNAGAAQGLGQFVTGTFTADGTSQTFTLNGPGGSTAPLINALQLRNLSASAVPGAGLAGLASIGLAGVSRRRRR